MKKQSLRFLAALLVLLCLLTVHVYAADDTSGTCGENLRWSYDETERILTITGTGAMDSYADGSTPWAEWSGSISEVDIPATVTSIGINAFKDCGSLYKVNYGGTLAQWLDTKIAFGNWQLGLAYIKCTDWKPTSGAHYGYFGDQGDRVLWLLDEKGNLTVYGTGSADDLCENPPAWDEWKAQIVTVTIKDGITGLDSKCFADCINLKTAEIADSTVYFGNMCFYNCSSLTSVRMPEKTTYHHLPHSMFSGCTSLKSVNIPEGTPVIESLAFYNCSALEEIRIPDSVGTIEALAFAGCSSLKQVELSKYVQRLTPASGMETLGKYPFTGCTALERIVVSEDNSTYSSENGVLYNKDKTWLMMVPPTMEGSFTIPDTVTWICPGAFESCADLTEITVPESVEDIDHQAFRGCTGLTEFTIPDSVTELGYDVFQDCTGLQQVTLSENAPELDGTFRGCSSLQEVTLPKAVTYLGYMTFAGCTDLTEVTIPKGVPGIGNKCFTDCTKLERINIPVTVTEIGKEAFLGCTALQNVSYSGYIGDWEKIEIGESNDPLLDAELSFAACSDHSKTVVPAVAPTCTEDGCTESSYCPACGEIFTAKETLPALGHDMDGSTCKRCGEVMDWYFNEADSTLTVYRQGPMDDYDGELDAPWDELRKEIRHVVISDGVTTVGNAAFAVCTELETVTLPEGITSIGRLAFQLCGDLKAVTLPESLTTIGEAAFNGCDSLLQITIPKNVSHIGENAFAGGLYTQRYTVDEANLYYCSDALGMLYNKDKTVLIQMPNALNLCLLPASVTEIGPRVFALSSHMDALYYGGSEEQWNAITIGVGNDWIPKTKYFNVTAESYCAEGRHFEFPIPGKEPTCTETGLSDGARCMLCETMTTEQTVLAKIDHRYANGSCTMCGKEAPVVLDNPFNDVANSDWYFSPVLWAVSNNITGGLGDGVFGPNASCTRGQVVTFLWAAAGRPEPKSTENPFTDVAVSDYFYKPVLWAVEQGITGGLGDGIFGPHATCTRGQIVTFLWAAQGKPAVTASSTFDDVADSDWYAKPVIWAAENEVTGGIAPGQFGPNNTCTRGQVVTFLYKVYQ